MTHHARAHVPARRLQPWMAIAVLCGPLAVAAAVLAGAHLTQGSSATLPATPTVDPRLVLHAHTVLVTGTLAGHAVRGTLYPGYPGANTLQISSPAPSGKAAPPIDLVASMPGMRMIPVVARLTAHGGAYRGVVPLPMFGTYTAQLTLVQGSAQRRGTAQLSLPLSLNQ